MKVDLPEPDGPTRNTNSPLSICTETSSRPTTPPWYSLMTLVEHDHRRRGWASRRLDRRSQSRCGRRIRALVQADFLGH